ncbi:hypothetical protein HZB02_05095 [Candidatus Woesearchaeota archaeon]|nr:hypothetical protein [Candidatus Woesearchaeota archaeon]
MKPQLFFSLPSITFLLPSVSAQDYSSFFSGLRTAVDRQTQTNLPPTIFLPITLWVALAVIFLGLLVYFVAGHLKKQYVVLTTPKTSPSKVHKP